MLRLTETQTILLSAAANREGGNVLPPPSSVKARGATLRRSLGSLRRQGLIAASGDPVSDGEATPRAEEPADLVITASGLAALGLEPSAPGGSEPASVGATGPEQHSAPAVDAENGQPAPEPVGMGTAEAGTPPRPGGKVGLAHDAIRAPGGATIEELTALLGWLPHTTRAALSRLRARGHAVTLRSREGRKAYHLEARA